MTHPLRAISIWQFRELRLETLPALASKMRKTRWGLLNLRESRFTVVSSGDSSIAIADRNAGIRHVDAQAYDGRS